MYRERTTVGLLIFSALLAVACAQGPVSSEQPPAATPPGSNTDLTGTQQSDWAAVERLEQQAKTLAKVAGCESSASCRTAPVGSRPCGGPRYYLPYCAKTTDSAALFRKLDEVAVAERAYNAKHQLVSTCEFRVPPAVEAVGGSCVAK